MLRSVMRSLVVCFVLLCSLAVQPSFATPRAEAVFGANLFTGAFKDQRNAGYNPDCLVMPGDVIRVNLWGALDLDAEIPVDEQGNLFIPKVGPLALQGVRNGDLNEVFRTHLAKVFKKGSVSVYANLQTSQPINVFVTGYVERPGLYPGLASDSILQYLDRANGIDLERGSFLGLQVLRKNRVVHDVNLYDFLLRGKMASFQFVDGDTILVAPLKNYVVCSGEVERPFRFEISSSDVAIEELLELAGPKPVATHLRVSHKGIDGLAGQQYFPLRVVEGARVQNGDFVEFVSDQRPETIAVSIQGEIEGESVNVVSRGTTLEALVSKLKLTKQANFEGIQLYRRSVARREKELLGRALKELEAVVLERSETKEEAAIRSKEAESVFKFVDRARQLEPQGRVVLVETDWSQIVLENGDRIVIPSADPVVLVQGEVMSPATHGFVEKADARDYIRWSGGFTRLANRKQVLVRKVDGRVKACKLEGFFSAAPKVQRGEEVLVLPKVDAKKLQIGSAVADVIYKIAVATSVVLTL